MKQPHKLDSLSIVISVRIDSSDRKRNLEFILKYLKRFFTSLEIIVVEQDTCSQINDLVENNPDVIYKIFSAPSCFYKARNLNHGIALASRKLVLILDSDVFVKPEALVMAADMLNQGQFSFIYPYNGLMLQLKYETLENNGGHGVIEDLPYQEIHEQVVPGNLQLEKLYGAPEWPSVGGTMMGKRLSFLNCGGFNPNIYSYGVEDGEFDYRIKKLGHKVTHLDNFNCYHIEHRRGIDSRYNDFVYSNRNEFERIKSMDETSLRHYIDNGFRLIELDTQRQLELLNSTEQFTIQVVQPAQETLPDIAFAVALMAKDAGVINQFDCLLRSISDEYTTHELLLLDLGGLSLSQFYLRPGTIHLHERNSRGLDRMRRLLNQSKRPLIVFLDPVKLLNTNLLNDGISHCRTSETYWINEQDNQNPVFISHRSILSRLFETNNKLGESRVCPGIEKVLNQWLDIDPSSV